MNDPEALAKRMDAQLKNINQRMGHYANAQNDANERSTQLHDALEALKVSQRESARECAIEARSYTIKHASETFELFGIRVGQLEQAMEETKKEFEISVGALNERITKLQRCMTDTEGVATLQEARIQSLEITLEPNDDGQR